MKLSHLALLSFRSAIDLKIPFTAPRVLIAGVNGVGKTNIREAIRWALTGRCEGTDGKGAGAEVLIPEGGKSADVICTVDGIGPVARTYNERGGGTMAVTGWTGTSQIQQAALYGRLNTIPQYLDAVLNTEVFLRLGHAEAKALILGLLNVKIQVGDKTYTLDEADIQYKTAFEDRKVAKKVLASTLVPPAPAAVQMPPIQAIEGQLAKLRAALGEQQKAFGAVAAQRLHAAVAIELENKRRNKPIREDVSLQIAALEPKLRELELAVVPVIPEAPPGVGDPTRIQFLRGKAEACAAQAGRITVQGSEAGCVLDRDVPCRTEFMAFDGQAQALLKEASALPRTNAKIAQLPPSESPLTAARKQLEALNRQEQDRLADIKYRDGIQCAVEQWEAKLAALPNTDAQEAEVAALQARIQKGEQLLRDARTHEQAVQNYEGALTARQIRQADVDRLEALVDELGPKGARAKALSEAMGRFQAAVNPYVEPFGWTISFSVEPWEVYANKRPVETYSKSERYRIGIALQMGIAMLSGLRFCIIDETDMLDVVNRGIVTQMLILSPLEQILVLGTREVAQALPKIAGVQAIRLEKKDGRTRVAEGVAG